MRIEPQCVFAAKKQKPLVISYGHARLARNVWALARGKLQKLPNMTQDFFPTLSTAECKARVEGYGEMCDDKLGHLEC